MSEDHTTKKDPALAEIVVRYGETEYAVKRFTPRVTVTKAELEAADRRCQCTVDADGEIHRHMGCTRIHE